MVSRNCSQTVIIAFVGCNRASEYSYCKEERPSPRDCCSISRQLEGLCRPDTATIAPRAVNRGGIGGTREKVGVYILQFFFCWSTIQYYDYNYYLFIIRNVLTGGKNRSF